MRFFLISPSPSCVDQANRTHHDLLEGTFILMNTISCAPNSRLVVCFSSLKSPTTSARLSLALHSTRPSLLSVRAARFADSDASFSSSFFVRLLHHHQHHLVVVLHFTLHGRSSRNYYTLDGIHGPDPSGRAERTQRASLGYTKNIAQHSQHNGKEGSEKETKTKWS